MRERTLAELTQLRDYAGHRLMESPDSQRRLHLYYVAVLACSAHDGLGFASALDVPQLVDWNPSRRMPHVSSTQDTLVPSTAR